jgi:hypoxanthine-DNA glycosylase
VAVAVAVAAAAVVAGKRSSIRSRKARFGGPFLFGFPPVADRRARVLVLGSMPGAASLAANEYYAFRHNQFWRIVGEIAGVPHDAPYARRTAALKRCRIALWDVVASCVRPGSLDAAIREDSVRVNDFAAFLAAHPAIRRVCFNGRKAEAAWRRRVAPTLAGTRLLEYRVLPSTSPAHAGMSYRAKLRIWRSAIPC